MLRRAVWCKFTDISEVFAASVTRDTSEISASFFQTTGRNNPEDSHYHTFRC
jgi:hypothetical protein